MLRAWQRSGVSRGGVTPVELVVITTILVVLFRPRHGQGCRTTEATNGIHGGWIGIQWLSHLRTARQSDVPLAEFEALLKFLGLKESETSFVGDLLQSCDNDLGTVQTSKAQHVCEDTLISTLELGDEQVWQKDCRHDYE